MTEEQHDPAGLELASEIATQIARSSPILPPVVDRPLPTRSRPRSRVTTEERSGAHPDERDPQLFGDVLSKISARRGWNKQMSLAVVLRDWPELVGPANADHSRPVRFEDGVLIVQCDSTVWATGMKYAAGQLVKTLNARLGQDTVKRISILPPRAPSWNKGPRTVRGGRGPRDTYG